MIEIRRTVPVTFRREQLLRFIRHFLEMVVAMVAGMMVLPFVILFVPLWAGVLSGETLLVAGHVLMLPAMIIAMLYRRSEYTQDHRRHALRP